MDKATQEKYLQDLFTLLQIPSISTLPEHKQDILAAAKWIEDYLGGIGMHVEQLYAKGIDKDKHHPVVFAERVDDPKNKTVLIYGHYDVQPVDPIDEWKSEPFKPEVRDGNIYARGATDNKGQVFAHMAAVHYLATEQWGDSWPINVKFLIEGEEERGGMNVESLVADLSNSDKLKADICLISDGPWVTKTHPTIEYGLRGISYLQVDVKLADADLHSGLFGGGVLNPANALSQMLAQLQDPKTGKILIPGFYDDVIDISKSEREKIEEIPFDEKDFLSEAANSKATWGEEGYTTKERTSARPTLDINGMWAGFTGEGAKTIIPATAHAKVSMRLVANQDPHKISQAFKDFINQIAPAEIDVSVTDLHGGNAVYTDLDSPEVKLAAEAMHEAFGVEPVFSRSGGSIPAVALIQNELGVKPILMNFGQPDDALHSPNEKLTLANFYGGMECSALLMQKLTN